MISKIFQTDIKYEKWYLLSVFSYFSLVIKVKDQDGRKPGRMAAYRAQ